MYWVSRLFGSKPYAGLAGTSTHMSIDPRLAATVAQARLLRSSSDPRGFMVLPVAPGARYRMPSAARHGQDTVWPLHVSGATAFRAADCEIGIITMKSSRIAGFSSSCRAHRGFDLILVRHVGHGTASGGASATNAAGCCSEGARFISKCHFQIS